MKVVGQRKQGKGGPEPLLAIEEFLKLVLQLRAGKPFVPRGIYKFKTIEEKETWRLKMLLGKRPVLPQ